MRADQTHFTASSPDKTLGAIVLCGGRSQRMGKPKAELPFGGETTLQRVVRHVEQVAQHVIVVGSRETKWPTLSSTVITTIDSTPFPGPLDAFWQGQRFLHDSVTRVLLCGCDFPLVRPEFLNQLATLQNPEDEILAVEQDGFLQPFPAVYRRSVFPVLQQLLTQGERSLQSLLRACRTHAISAERLRIVDPNLDSLRNMNSPEDYQELLQIAGLSD